MHLVILRGPIPLGLMVTLITASCDRGEGPNGSIGTQDTPIVDGQKCAPWIEDSIVGIGLDSGQVPLSEQSYCSGAVVAANVVLTARHCVAELYTPPWEEHECRVDGKVNASFHFGPASTQTVYIFDSLAATTPLARAVQPLVPTAKSLCNNDVALLLLDRPLAAKVPARIRALEAKDVASGRVTRARDPWVTVAGFGLLDDGLENDRGCQQKKVKILADGTEHPPYLGTYEFVADYGTCHGDSGGPVFDASGQLVGVTSRGTGGSCRAAGVYPDLAHHRTLLRSALATAP